MALKEKSRLVIVESPAKAKTINKILGKDYFVKASVGHILDLPKKELGVDTENGFKPTYVTIPGKEKTIEDLKEAAKKASVVYLAPDPDREGEAIAWHIAEVIAVNGKKTNLQKVYRITFNEITEKAVKEAIEKPSEIDLNKVNAQQARRVLDRLVGYRLSPFLWKKVQRGLSAGRVQSVSVRLIVDREREIEAFVSQEYWSLIGLFDGQIPPVFNARLFKYEGETVIERSAKGNKFLITNEAKAKEIRELLEKSTYKIKSVEKKDKKRTPLPPFITSTLQQEASRRLRFTAKRTMMVAQKLYEGIELGQKGSVGLITYMRTDSTRIAAEAVEWARQYISERFGKEFLPKTPHKFKVKSSAQEAHEAIRPTYSEYTPETIKTYLKPEQFALYELIWNRFIASQMAQALLEQTTFDIEDAKALAIFRASGTIIKFKGFLALYDETVEKNDDEEDAGILPDLQQGAPVELKELTPNQHFTQPPPRYTEATLVKTLEEKGIGRPSTYAAILSTIEERKYVEKTDGKFKPTELGSVVNDLLVERFPRLLNVKFTAEMENDLDKIEEGQVVWTDVMNEFYPSFSKELEKASEDQERVKPVDKPTDVICEKCQSPMVLKWGRHGRFLACSAYPDCKNTKQPAEDAEDSGKVRPVETETNEICEKCGSPMVIKVGRYGRFLACSKYPDCKNMKPIPTGLKCPLDGGDVVERKTKKGKLFYGCSNYPDCNFATWQKPVMQECPDCGTPFLLEKKDKNGNTILYCQNKGCKYKKEV